PLGCHEIKLGADKQRHKHTPRFDARTALARWAGVDLTRINGLPIVLKVGSTVVLTADMETNNGTLDEHGKPDTDFISTSTAVHIDP
ncbi:hypothetical protein GWC77_28185, partial [Paraburkholderia sp. NMBU_R16]|nr:hypothetical protein [Paraburkholderia sp. NMBU_R16]